MDEKTKQQLLEKNEKLIAMVIERVKRDFPEDIGIIGLVGSFCHDDYYEKSDLDLIIINNTDRGWDICHTFILGDVGYDIYCTPWETRINAQANLESPMISSLLDMKIVYCAKPEYMDRLNTYKQKALDTLALPIGKACIERAKKDIDYAKQDYTDALLVDDIGAVRYASSKLLYNVINALTSLNNTYFKRGVKRYVEQLATYTYLPKDFERLYTSVLDSKTVQELRETTFALLSSVVSLYDSMVDQFVEKQTPNYDILRGTYEELWCNYRNKVIKSVEEKDKSYAFHVAKGAQEFFDEMRAMFGTPKFDVMKYFDSENLDVFREAFLKMMDEYKKEYDNVGRKVEYYESFEQLYSQFMKC